MTVENFLTTWVFGKKGRYVADAVSALMIILLLAMLYQFFQEFEFIRQLIKQKPVVQRPIQVKKIPDMAEWHLLGLYIPALSDAENLRKTNLNIKLVGVFASVPDSQSQAVIATSNGEQKRYRVGDTVPGGATIYKILPDAVVLLRQGNYENLPLPKEAVKFESRPKPLTMEQRQP